MKIYYQILLIKGRLFDIDYLFIWESILPTVGFVAERGKKVFHFVCLYVHLCKSAKCSHFKGASQCLSLVHVYTTKQLKTTKTPDDRMNRRNTERLSSDSHDLSSKQRIVRRKDPRSPSPQLTRSASHREVRTSNADIYSKIGHAHRSSKYVDFRHSSGDLRDERLGGSKERSFTPRHHDNLENHGDLRGGAGRSIGSMRKGSGDLSGAHHSSVVPYHDKFEYSLHVSNLNGRMSDGEAKISLFRDFKKFGFVNIKVIGCGKDRHAFINFTRLEDARSALNEMDNAPICGNNIEVTWSRSTVNRYPQVSGNSHSEHRPMGGRGAKSRSYQNEGTLGFFNSNGRSTEQFQDPQRNSRDINYQHSSPVPTSRNHSVHSTKEVSVKSTGPIIDPNATRTLFVGNLESDVTERELRDLFSPYGRIECVDIKVQRSICTAYAFVKFFTITDAMNAKTDMHGRKYGNIKLKIGFGKGSPSAKVWVGNLTNFADLSEVRLELDRFGLIRRVDYNNGDNHAFVHFDSLDAAQAAVSSLTTYRFRSSNRPLKIDLSQPVQRPGSDFEDYDSDFHDIPIGIGIENSRQVHSHTTMSPDINPHPVMSRRGGVSGSDDYSRQLSHDGAAIVEHGMGMSMVKSSFRSSRGRRVVQDHSHHAPDTDMDYLGERNSYRKRGRSPSMDEVVDMSEHRQQGAGGSFRPHHSDRGGASNPNGHHRGGGAQNGDFEFKAKRPRNGFNAYQYHKLHGSHIGGMSDRIGTASQGGGREHREYHDKEVKGRVDDRHRERRGGERRERGTTEHVHGGRGGRGRGGRTSSDRRVELGSDRNNSDSSNPNKGSIEKVSPPPPPPPPPPPAPIMEMMSYESSDSALKLNDSTGPTSPTGVGGHQPGLKGADSKVENLSDMARVYPVVWHGNLVLKNTGFPTRMHLIGGDPAVAELLLRCKDPKDDSNSLRITQRLRLEPPRLEEVNKRMSSAGPSGHCILLALPGAIPAQPAEESASADSATNGAMQLRPLKSLVSYLDQKEAAGIVALNATDNLATNAQRDNIIGVLHAFPPCEFSQSQLLKIAPNLGSEPAKDEHVVVLLVKGTV